MKIKLGKLPDTSSVKLIVVLPAALKAQIDRYAQLHTQTWQQDVDAAVLIPHILRNSSRMTGRSESLRASAPKFYDRRRIDRHRNRA